MTVTLDIKTGEERGVSPSADEHSFSELAKSFASMAWMYFMKPPTEASNGGMSNDRQFGTCQ